MKDNTEINGGYSILLTDLELGVASVVELEFLSLAILV